MSFNIHDVGQPGITVDVHAAFASHGKAAAQCIGTPSAAAPSVSALPAPPQEGLHACRMTAPSATVEMQMGAVTSHVQHLLLADEAGAAPCRLVTDLPQPLLTAAPARRTSAPPKSRAASVPPPRQSARQVAQGCQVSVHDLGLLGPNDKMTPKAAEALVKRFAQPLSEEDITGLARLTRLDEDALRIAAGLAGPDGAALGANA